MSTSNNFSSKAYDNILKTVNSDGTTTLTEAQLNNYVNEAYKEMRQDMEWQFMFGNGTGPASNYTGLKKNIDDTTDHAQEDRSLEDFLKDLT